MPRVTLLTRPGCHLCDEAREVLRGVVGERFDERSITDDPALEAQYAEEIPVLLLDDRVHAIWRIDADRLRAALELR